MSSNDCKKRMLSNGLKAVLSKEHYQDILQTKDARGRVREYSVEDKQAWERWAETMLITLLQDKDLAQNHDHKALVQEAGLMADMLLNLSKQRFSDTSEDSVFDGTEQTGTYPIFGVNTSRKANNS